jgi:hypothetical protein
MVYIENSGLIGTGHHRECYRHPENNNLCIKIVVSGNNKEQKREKKYYRRLKKMGISWDMIPKYYGDIETNMGPGSVFDLVLDHDGALSKPLKHYLSSSKWTEANYSRLSNALDVLKDDLLQQQIITMTLKPKNILCKEMASGSLRLYIIDNIGNSVLFPICNVSRYFAKKKILRKWGRFEDRLLIKYKHNNALHQILTNTQTRA